MLLPSMEADEPLSEAEPTLLADDPADEPTVAMLSAMAGVRVARVKAVAVSAVAASVVNVATAVDVAGAMRVTGMRAAPRSVEVPAA